MFMAKYIEVEDRSVQQFGTSLAITLPSTFVKKNGIKKGDMVRVKLSGGTDMLGIAKKE